MPITLYPSPKPLASVSKSRLAKDPRALLKGACTPNVTKKCGEIFQSSFAASESTSKKASEERFAATILSETAVIPTSNSLLHTAVQAYNEHHHLVLRPDDVWMAILSQFNLFVNANAEELRHLFVEHKGQKELTIYAVSTRYAVHFGVLARQMGRLIQENVKDPNLREWIIPTFSTTTENDVSSVIMMATLKAYFSYGYFLGCGLPAMTLLGEKVDWESLLVKAGKLSNYGEQTAQWYSLLKPVLTAFVRSFEEPESDRTKDFWQSIAHYRRGSGFCHLSGWITAFCFFDQEGKRLDLRAGKSKRGGHFEMDGVVYHIVDTKNIPPAYVEVNVKLDDNGLQIPTIMVAGLVGMEITHSRLSSNMKLTGKDDDTVKPVAGWWLFEEAKEGGGSSPADILSKMRRPFWAFL